MSQSSQNLPPKTKDTDGKEVKIDLPLEETAFAKKALSALGLHFPSTFSSSDEAMKIFISLRQELKKIPLDKVGGKNGQAFLLYQLQYFNMEAQVMLQLNKYALATTAEEKESKRADDTLGDLIREVEIQGSKLLSPYIEKATRSSARLFMEIRNRLKAIDTRSSESIKNHLALLYRVKKIIDNSGCYHGMTSVNFSLLHIKVLLFQSLEKKPSLNEEFNEYNKIITDGFQLTEKHHEEENISRIVQAIVTNMTIYNKENETSKYMIMLCLFNEKKCSISQLSGFLLNEMNIMKASGLASFLFDGFKQIEVKSGSKIDIEKVAIRLKTALELHLPQDTDAIKLIDVNLKKQKEIKQAVQDKRKLLGYELEVENFDPAFGKRTKQINKKLGVATPNIEQLTKLKSVTNDKREELMALLKEVEKFKHPLLKDFQDSLKKGIVNKIAIYDEIIAKIDTVVSKRKKAKEEKQEKKDSFLVFQKTPEAKTENHDVFDPKRIENEIPRLVAINKSFKELEENVSKMSAEEVKAELDRLNKNRRDVCNRLNKDFYSNVPENLWRELSELQLKTEKLLVSIGTSMNKVERLLLKKEKEENHLSKEKDTSPKTLIPSLSMPRTESTTSVSSDTILVAKEEAIETEQKVVEEKKELDTKEAVTKPAFDWQKGFALSDIEAILTPGEKKSVEHIPVLANELKKIGIDLLIRGSVVLRWLAFLSTGKLVPANDIDCILQLPADYDKSAFDTIMEKYGYKASATTFKKVGFFPHKGPSFITYKNSDHKTDMTCVQKKSYKSTDPFLLTQLQLGFGLENRFVISEDQAQIAKIAIEHLKESQFVFGWPSINDVYDSRNYPRLAKYIKKSDDNGNLFTFYSVDLKNSEAVLLTAETLQRNSRYYYGFKCTHNLHNQNEVKQCYGDIKKMLADDTFKTPAGKIIVESFCIGVLKRKLKLGGYAHSDDPLHAPDEAEINERGCAMAHALQHHYSQSGQNIHQLKSVVETLLNSYGTMGLTPQSESQRKSYRF